MDQRPKECGRRGTLNATATGEEQLMGCGGESQHTVWAPRVVQPRNDFPSGRCLASANVVNAARAAVDLCCQLQSLHGIFNGQELLELVAVAVDYRALS